MNIISNFTPHKTLTVDDKEPPYDPPFYKISYKRKTMFIKAIEIVKATTTTTTYINSKDLHNAVEVSKLNYYSRITCKLTHMQKNTTSLLDIIKKISQ